MMLSRFYDNLEEFLKPNKALIIYGSRQVGKSTLLNNFLNKTKLKYKFVLGDDIKAQAILGAQDLEQLEEFVAGYELLVLDEAQRIPNIGMGLKMIVDNIPGIMVIATGSASFELMGQVGEPLTGRKKSLILYPLAQMELLNWNNKYELKEKIGQQLVFGSYPEVLTASSKEEKKEVLEELISSYLLKDILELEKVKGAKVLLDLLRLLAFQVGQEVSLSELGRQLGLDYKTVARYLDLLEKSFILYNLRGYSRNLRKELTKKSKYYFYDNGIRNALISNFNDLNIRNDVGQLWENFLVIERLKKQEYKSIYANNYFWRTWDQHEIDWVEEREGKLFAFEFKWGKDKVKKPKEFLETYPNSEFKVITKDNYLDFIT